jgi:phosphohistidine phosphatase SixA
MRPAKTLGCGLIVLLMLGIAGTAPAADTGVERLKAGGVLLLRHALAPGFGDPPEFRVDDCSTQRNLNDEGRRQAATIGDWLRARGITEARVYSSQWCRCLETARLLDLGEVTPLPALNSFFQQRSERDARLAALREFLANLPPQDTPLILVTHQVTVSALSGLFADSGKGVVATLKPNGELSDFSRLDFGR